MTALKLLFFATEDWFIRSHFLPLLRRAKEEGYDVVVVARSTGALANEGVRLIDTPFARGSLRPWDVGAQLSHLRAVLERERPDIVHAIALKPITLLLLSRYRTGRVLALTGRGYLGASRAWWPRFVAWQLQRRIAAASLEPQTILLTENKTDIAWAGATEGNSMVMPGAGVDPKVFLPAHPPTQPPIVVGVVARLIRSKGIDLVVDAIRQLRESGLDVSLRIAGAADPENPEHVSDAVVAEWRAMLGVELLGRVDDVNAFWATAHIACLASRGGEGLPRSLLEAAACGRPIVTTDAPGCADFVVDGQTGFVVPRENASALADALRQLIGDEASRRSMGEAARAHVLEGYTETHAADCAARAWRRLTSGGR